MLSQHDRNRLTSIEGVILSEKKLGVEKAVIFSLDTVHWLVKHLKETNDELKEKNKKIEGLRREISITDDEFNKLASKIEYCEKNHLN